MKDEYNNHGRKAKIPPEEPPKEIHADAPPRCAMQGTSVAERPS